MANLNLSLISAYIALCSTNKHHSHIPSTNLSTYLPFPWVKLTSYCPRGHHYTMFFGDFPGLGHLGSLVPDPALVYPQLWTSRTLIHAQKRSIEQSPETWIAMVCGGVQPSKGKLKFGTGGGVLGHGASAASDVVGNCESNHSISPIYYMNMRKHTEMGWACGTEGISLVAGHGRGFPHSTFSVTCSMDWDMAAQDGGGGGDHPTESNIAPLPSTFTMEKTSLPPSTSTLINPVDVINQDTKVWWDCYEAIWEQLNYVCAIEEPNIEAFVNWLNWVAIIHSCPEELVGHQWASLGGEPIPQDLEVLERGKLWSGDVPEGLRDVGQSVGKGKGKDIVEKKIETGGGVVMSEGGENFQRGFYSLERKCSLGKDV
ncbi:hypothetical protein EDC04DRAFT_2599637 [Pisolithus marmoratus]|nr:hypothetical protein EDC04DRAFT_2599637 [Pisolithus marmoratus]